MTVVGGCMTIVMGGCWLKLVIVGDDDPDAISTRSYSGVLHPYTLQRITPFYTLLLGTKTKLRQATISALESGDSQLHTLMDVMTALGFEMVIRERSKAGASIEELF